MLYRVLRRIEHDLMVYAPGATIELKDEAAKLFTHGELELVRPGAPEPAETLLPVPSDRRHLDYRSAPPAAPETSSSEPVNEAPPLGPDIAA